MPAPNSPEEGGDWGDYSRQVFDPEGLYEVLIDAPGVDERRIRTALFSANGDPDREAVYLSLELERLLDRRAETLQHVIPEEISPWRFRTRSPEISRSRRLGYWVSSKLNAQSMSPEVAGAAGITLAATGIVGIFLISSSMNPEQPSVDLTGLGTLIVSIGMFASGLYLIDKSKPN